MKKKLTIRVGLLVEARLRDEAAKSGKPVAEVAVAALEAGLKPPVLVQQDGVDLKQIAPQFDAIRELIISLKDDLENGLAEADRREQVRLGNLLKAVKEVRA